MSFLDELKKTTNKTVTENGAVTNASSLDPVLDFFSQAGSMRGRSGDAVKLFQRAYATDPLMALRALFYLRDIRGGQGERELFRACLPQVSLPILLKNIPHIPEFGRYDDLFSLNVGLVAKFIKKQIEADEAAMTEGKSVSLLAKWMPSENTSSDKTRKLALKLAKELGLSPAKYRKKVVALRKYIKLLEQRMSTNQWAEVDYEKTPSQALRKHVKAFKRHDEERFNQYMSDVESGEKKINTSTLYTYEVFDMVKQGEDRVADAMWANLPDYTNGNNALVVADVSGSMAGRPVSISVSLALYFAERNQGAFNGYFMTFSDSPQLHRVMGSTLTQKLACIENAEWGMNTNLEAAFEAILSAARKAKAEANEIPKVLYIISDMEFDRCVHDGDQTNLENAKQKFEEAGYTLPHVVFWNVESRNNQTPATMHDSNVTLISGASQSTFRYAVEGKTPIESMNDILNSERYAVINI